VASRTAGNPAAAADKHAFPDVGVSYERNPQPGRSKAEERDTTEYLAGSRVTSHRARHDATIATGMPLEICGEFTAEPPTETPAAEFPAATPGPTDWRHRERYQRYEIFNQPVCAVYGRYK